MKQDHCLLLALLFFICFSTACSRSGNSQNEDAGIVGAWHLVEESSHGLIVGPDTNERFRIFYADSTYLTTRIIPGMEVGMFIATGKGRYCLCDSVYTEPDDSVTGVVVNDSVLRLCRGEVVQIWKAYSAIDKSTRALMRELAKDCVYTDKFGHQMFHVLSITEVKAKIRKRIAGCVIGVSVVLVLCALGYSAHSRRQRRLVEQRLAAFEAGRRQASEENKQALVASEHQFLKSEFYLSLCRKIEAGEVMRPKDWDELASQVEQLSPGFSDRLNALYRLSLQEYRVSLLLKARLTPSEIAVLICKSQSAVTSIRSRLYQKVFGRKGGAREWDELVLSL